MTIPIHPEDAYQITERIPDYIIKRWDVEAEEE